MKPPYSYAPALPAAIGISVGIVIANFGTLWAIAATCIGLASFVLLYFTHKHYFSFYFLMMSLGALVLLANTPNDLPETALGHSVDVSATIKSLAYKPQSRRCVLEIDSINHEVIAPVRCLLYGSEDDLNLQLGAGINLIASLNALSTEHGVPYEIDYEKFLRYDGITCTIGYTGSHAVIIKEPNWYYRTLTKTRNSLFNAIVDSPINGETAGFLVAVILSEDQFLSPQLFDNYRAAGLSHMLALSGLHVGLIASMISLLLLPINFFRGSYVVKPLLVIALIWIYAIIVGLSPSVTRASVMLTVYLIASLMQRGSHAFNSLCIAAIVILIINPYSIFTPGFQMTFAAVASILLFSCLLPNSLRRRPWLFYLLTLIVTSIAAMLGTGIVAAYYFHALPLLFLPANMAGAMVFPWLLGTGIILVFCTLMHLHAAWVGAIANALFWVMDSIASSIASIGGMHWQGLFFSAWCVLPYAVSIVILGIILRRIIAGEKIKLQYWLTSIGFFILFVTMLFALQPKVPRAELYLPRGNPAGIIVRAGDRAFAKPLSTSTDPQRLIEYYNMRFRDFLISRGCGPSFLLLPDTVNVPPFYIHDKIINASDELMILINSPAVNQAVHCNYALVSDGYVGKIEAIRHYAHCDSVLLCNGVNGRRAKKFMESADTIPMRNLRGRTFSRVYW